MAIKCKNCPLAGKSLFAPMSANDIATMQQFKSGELNVEPGTPLLMEGSNAPQLYTALSGLGLRYKTLEDGRRQVLNFVFPGDFIGLQAGIMGEMAHSVEATTSMRLCVFNRSEFFNFLSGHPGRAFDLTWIAAAEEHFLGEALATIGQRTAVSSVAWALMRLFLRAEALGMTSGAAMPLPFRQQDLADALGLSLVHTNKTLAKLRDRQLATWSEGILRIPDLDALGRAAGTAPEPPILRPLM